MLVKNLFYGPEAKSEGLTRNPNGSQLYPKIVGTSPNFISIVMGHVVNPTLYDWSENWATH